MTLGRININSDETNATRKAEEINAMMEMYSECMSCTNNVKLKKKVKKWQQEPSQEKT